MAQQSKFGNPANFNTTPATRSSNDASALEVDSVGNLLISLNTLLAGEDLTNNVLKTEQRFGSSAVLVADAQVKAGAGFLHTITFSQNDAAPTAGTLIVYDSLTETGTILFNHTFTTLVFNPFSIILDVSFATGLYFGFTTTADVNVVCSFR